MSDVHSQMWRTIIKPVAGIVDAQVFNVISTDIYLIKSVYLYRTIIKPIVGSVDAKVFNVIFTDIYYIPNVCISVLPLFPRS